MLASPKYLAAIAGVVIVLNAAAFFWLRHRSPAPPTAKRSQEMVLGAFEYKRVDPRDKQVQRGQIVVTLHFAEDLDARKVREIHDQEGNLQAAVEDAMRRLRASDLADPRFIRVKNRFQERLNEELGFDGIDNVIVAKAPEPAPQEEASDPQAPADATDASAETPADAPTANDTNPKR
jgi:hypothetical protein